MKTTTTEPTAADKDELCGGPWADRYPIPDEDAFDAAGLGRLAAPDLAAIAGRLIRRDGLGLGHLERFRLLVLWAKAGGTAGGKPRWGSVALANPDLKHVTEQLEGQPADAVVRLAADNLREAQASRWQVANELCFLLMRIGLYTTQEGGDERLTLVAPDAAFFTAQVKLFGPQTPEMRRAATVLAARQTVMDFPDGHPDGRPGGVPDDGGGPEGSPSPTATNGRDHGPLLDPDRVMATLSERGWSIAWHQPADGEEGRYVNAASGTPYDRGDVESEYRRAMAGRPRGSR